MAMHKATKQINPIFIMSFFRLRSPAFIVSPGNDGRSFKENAERMFHRGFLAGVAIAVIAVRATISNRFRSTRGNLFPVPIVGKRRRGSS
jgi:hypothetical protein